jgi:hypothetical protein
MSRTQPKRHTHDAGDIISGKLRRTVMGTGTPSAGNFLRGDGTWTPVAGGGATRGLAEVDFGAFPGAVQAQVAVTGQAGIVATSAVRAWIKPDTTPEHSPDEHLVAAGQLDVVCTDIVPATGFTIQVLARWQGTTPLLIDGPAATQNTNATAGLNTRAAPFGPGTLPGPPANLHYGRYALAWEYA